MESRFVSDAGGAKSGTPTPVSRAGPHGDKLPLSPLMTEGGWNGIMDLRVCHWQMVRELHPLAPPGWAGARGMDCGHRWSVRGSRGSRPGVYRPRKMYIVKQQEHNLPQFISLFTLQQHHHLKNKHAKMTKVLLTGKFAVDRGKLTKETLTYTLPGGSGFIAGTPPIPFTTAPL